MPKGSTLEISQLRVLPSWGPRICLRSDHTVSAIAVAAVGNKKNRCWNEQFFLIDMLQEKYNYHFGCEPRWRKQPRSKRWGSTSSEGSSSSAKWKNLPIIFIIKNMERVAPTDHLINFEAVAGLLHFANLWFDQLFPIAESFNVTLIFGRDPLFRLSRVSPHLPFLQLQKPRLKPKLT